MGGLSMGCIGSFGTEALGVYDPRFGRSGPIEYILNTAKALAFLFTPP